MHDALMHEMQCTAHAALMHEMQCTAHAACCSDKASPSAPSPRPADDGCVALLASRSPPPPPGRRLLWDDSVRVVTKRRSLLQDPNLGYVESRSVGRLAESAGRSAGVAADGAQTVTDLDDDALYVTDFPHNAKFAYHGVPWAPPQVGDFAAISRSGDLEYRGGEGRGTGLGYRLTV
jgi:hypothetical protein